MQEEETALTAAELERVHKFKCKRIMEGTKHRAIPSTPYSNTAHYNLSNLATTTALVNEPTLPIPTVPPNPLVVVNET